MVNLNEIIRICPVCREKNTIVPVCKDNGTTSYYGILGANLETTLLDFKSFIPVKCDICKNCGHIMFFHANPEQMKINKR